MKINFTKKEYQTLIDALEIASWVLHSHKIEEREETKKYRDLEQKLYSYAKDFGMKHLIVYDKKLEKYFPTKDFEDQSPAMAFMEEYDNDTFWDELINRLALRDLILQEGEERFKEMPFEEHFTKEDPIRQKYQNEFESNGINNLNIDS